MLPKEILLHKLFLFSEEEKFDCYMLTAGVMSHGGIEFKTKGRDDQAECEAIGPETFPGKVAGALQVDAFPMITMITMITRWTRSP